MSRARDGHALYLNQPNILTAAELAGVDAIHPGYGFLAENAQFASAVRAMGKVFVALQSDTSIFDKLSAKAAARDAGLPLLKGSEGAVSTLERARRCEYRWFSSHAESRCWRRRQGHAGH